jgi:G3E family GTPase
MPSLVAANIVTGFLGSGKTTLLKSALKKGLAGRKVAFIVNDFGEIGIDGVVLKGMNVDRLVELPSGCICCTIGSRFALAVQEIVETYEPHLIVIETSGVTEPGPLISELSLVGVRTDSVITVADAENIIRFCKENETVVRQVEEADFVIINKTDLATPKELIRLEKHLRRLNPRAIFFPTTYGQVQDEILFATSAATYWRRPVHSEGNDNRRLHLNQDSLTSFSFQREGVMVRHPFEAFLSKLPPEIYRAKGIVKFSGEGWSSIFNYTCGRSQLDWLSPAEGNSFHNRAVVIGKNLAPMRDGILRELEKCFEATTMTARQE